MTPLPFKGQVDQLLGRVLPSVASVRIDHVFLVVGLRLLDSLNSKLRVEDVPRSIGGKDEATMLRDVELIHVKVGLRRDNEDIIFGVVRPEVA